MFINNLRTLNSVNANNKISFVRFIMNKITFFIALTIELLAAPLTLDVYLGTPKCIISALILFAACLLIVFGIYSIIKKTSRLPKSGKLQFYQNDILKERL